MATEEVDEREEELKELGVEEKLKDVETEIEATKEELAERPRVDLRELRSKYRETEDIYLEFEDESVIKFIIRKGLPWAKTNAVERKVTKINPRTNDFEVDIFKYMELLWSDIVVGSDPKIDLKELQLMDGEIANQIMVTVYNAYNEVHSAKRLRKNLQP